MAEERKMRVYCETSFWSYLTGRPTTDEKIARDQALTLKWWEEIAPSCEIYISQHVKTEAADGGAKFAARRQEAMRGALTLDADIPEAEELAAYLIAGHAVPDTEGTDAAHIATATVYGMDVLLTLNCKHMVNPVTLPKTAALIGKQGYDCPVIITPGEFLERKEGFDYGV